MTIDIDYINILINKKNAYRTDAELDLLTKYFYEKIVDNYEDIIKSPIKKILKLRTKNDNSKFLTVLFMLYVFTFSQ